MRDDVTQPALPGLPAGARYLPELEGLRGLAVALVFALHLEFYLAGEVMLPGDRVSLLYAFVRSGHTGVSLFFLLSGFLVTRPFLEERLSATRVRLRRYAANRALRILPLFWAVMLFGTAWTAARPADLARALPYLTLSFAVVPTTAESIAPFSYVWWSLATEIQFYVVLPFVFLAMRGRRGRLWATLLALAWAAAYAAFLVHGRRLEVHAITVSHSLIGRAPQLLLGAAVAWVWLRRGPDLRRHLASSAWLRRGGGDAMLLAILAALAVVLRGVAGRGYLVAEVPPEHLWHVVEGALWGAVMLAFLVLPLRLRAVVVNRWMIRLGLVSYSIYLVHMPVLHAVFHGLPWLRTSPRPSGATAAAVALATVATLCVSTATFHLIERPFLRRKSRSPRAPAARPAADVAAAS